MDTKVYIFNLEYGNRKEEKKFIKDILNTFDQDTVVGCGVFVNNNPYNLELLLWVSLAKDVDIFEGFIQSKYKKKERVVNYFIGDILDKVSQRRYNAITFVDCGTVDLFFTEGSNNLFFFPDKSIVESIFGGGAIVKKSQRVFLSHSSKDKKIIDHIFNEFQKNDISAWYDKHEIEPGDSITDKINDGLEKSDIGIICISSNFINGSSGWGKSELNYFVQRRMNNSDKKLIILNLDLPYEELPPLLQDYRYIDYRENDAIEILISYLKKALRYS